MGETQVVISKGASEDISKLASGANRVDVALSALLEQGDFSPAQIAALQALAQRFEKVASNHEAPSLAQPVHQEFQLSVVDKTRTVAGVVTGTIEVQYVIPANIDHAAARAKVIRSCEAMEDRTRPAIWSGDLDWYPKQETEKGDDPKSQRIVNYTIDFDSKDPRDGTMDMAGHRAYAKARGAHIASAEVQALGAALYYEKTGDDLMKGYWTRAVVSKDESAPGVAVETNPHDGVRVNGRFDAFALGGLVAAFSPN